MVNCLRNESGGTMSGIRAQQKEKTRQALIDAAFNQLSAEHSFSNLSLREVAREAGIAPTSFYRHFKDMNELGLTLVDVAREIKHFILELAHYLENETGCDANHAYIQAEAMVTLVFNAGAEALDLTKAQREQLTERIIWQLRYIAKGASSYTKEKKAAK